MELIDLLISILLVWAFFRGFSRGVIKQVTMLAALILGIFGAIKLSGFTAENLKDNIKVSSEYLYMISIGITFLVVFIAVHFLGNIVEKVVKSAELSLLNRFLGMIFSLSRTIIVLGLLLAFVARIDQKSKILSAETREKSFFYKPFTSVTYKLFPSLRLPVSFNEDDKQDLVYFFTLKD
jgi:membrane protein required for colicin V production